MNPSEYISSGNLELYALGRLDAAGDEEAERYIRQHPEVRQELERIELTLERYALAHGIAPDPAVLNRLIDDIKPTDPQADAPHDRVDPVADAQTGAGWLTWLTWLALALLALLLVLAVSFYRDKSTAEETLGIERERFDVLERQCAEVAERERATSRRLRTITRPATRDVLLVGTDNAPEARATVYYNPELKQTLFTARNLPAPPAGRQYQLWAIDAEGPKDLGVLDRDLAEGTLLDVEYVPGTATFAITLETDGGNPTPDLTAIQVAGNVD